MIQRIQSIYLLLTTVLSVLFLSGNIISFISPDGLILNITFSSIYPTNGEGKSVTGSSILFIVPVMLTGLISLLAIFMYRRRLVQLWLVRLTIISTLAGIIGGVYYVIILINKNNVDPEIGLRMLIPLLVIVLNLLAYRGIRHDEKLVHSYDRLR